ncbi:MAG: sodium:calcium antiporter [Dokdonella sp.]
MSGLLVRRQPRAYAAALIAAASAALFPLAALALAAIWMSEHELALGGIVGGSIAQLGLLLGLAALLAPLLARLKVLNWINPILLVAVVLVFALGFDQAYSLVDGLVLLSAGLMAIVLIVRAAAGERATAAALFEQAPRVFGLPMLLMRLVLGMALLGLGAWRLIDGSEGLAAILAVNPLILGLLVVGPASALAGAPTALLAARRGHGELALGQTLFGASAGLLIVLGAVVLWQPLAVSASLMRLELPALFALALAVYPMMRSDGELSRREGMVLLVSYAVIVALELWLTSA